jgi:hypothetical protein
MQTDDLLRMGAKEGGARHRPASAACVDQQAGRLRYGGPALQ